MRFLILILFLFSTISTFSQNDINRGYSVKIGEYAPEINLKLLDGREINNENLLGKVVVIQFTASWCSVCIKEMPHLEEEVWQRFKDEDFILVGVDLKEELSIVNDFIKKTEVTYPFTIDNDGTFFESFTLPGAGVTRNIVIDKKGKISFLTRLFDEKEFQQMIEHIDILLQ